MDRALIDFPMACGTTWVFAPPAIAGDFSGGQAEFAAWDSAGTLSMWAGTAGRTNPTAPATGTMVITVASAATTFSATFKDTVTAALPGPYTHEFDYWDAAGKHYPGWAGNIVSNGRPMP